MNANLKPVEIEAEVSVVEREDATKADAMNELSSFELAYVGGGMAVVSFI